MSTFMGAAWIELRSAADATTVLDALRDGAGRFPLDAWVVSTPDGCRIELLADGVGYEQLARSVADAMLQPGAVRRALVALDHDEYGAEHLALGLVDGRPHRVHHVYIHPRDDETGEPFDEGEPTSTDIPALGGLEPGAVLVEGAAARASLARLFEIPVERVEAAAVEAESAHEELGIIGGPFTTWLTALNLPWIGESGDPRISLRP
ncbi:hypothetical protein [Actinoplanes awajinensis]|uniref:Uncharacterized protein n=1 Tax=Actinoplanes awajinensis subsp. mycoplanecinus TaxID=135947 RepID=A0A124GA27_9ACTN|nr:hypothetical protein [Actinoplanes awajinensis]KUL30941.1 hypothetical protein ADL15_23615 [Actinoplanes awajinensis subsp. mycoplanecinus]